MMQEEKHVKFEKGKVSEYNGQQDIYCDFVTVTEGSRQEVFYLLNDKKLDHGFYIASTVLKEAIDSQILRTHLGLIDQKGNVIIPFENKLIKVIENEYLLVVRTATKTMANANVSIKDKLNLEMNNQGKFILNDLLSEGTVYNLEGKNIFDNQYYSFIGITDDSFYCSANTPESSVVKVPRSDYFAVIPSDVITDDKESQVVNPILPEVKPSDDEMNKDETLDVSNVSVAKDMIEDALKSGTKEIVQEVENVAGVDHSFDFQLPPISIDKSINATLSEGEDSKIETNDEVVTSSSKLEENINTSEKAETTEDSVLEDSDNQNQVFAGDENTGDVVHAISDIVQRNKKLEEENRALNDKVSALEEENLAYQGKIIEFQQLKDRNEKLTAAMAQIRQELGITSSSSNSESYEYQKVA